MKATRLWTLWQAILLSLALGFTTRGKQRFVQWATGLALDVEEHTITQSLVALDRVHDWKALESFAEYGSWELSSLQWGIARRLDRLPHRTWHGYSVWAGDDTKVRRNSKDVWGYLISASERDYPHYLADSRISKFQRTWPPL